MTPALIISDGAAFMRITNRASTLLSRTDRPNRPRRGTFDLDSTKGDALAEDGILITQNGVPLCKAMKSLVPIDVGNLSSEGDHFI